MIVGAFSPDGTKLSVATQGALWVVAYPEGASRQIIAGRFPPQSGVSCMPDSRHFVTTWLDGRQTFGLRMVDTETGTTRTIYSAPASLLSPRVSPDGTRLAFVTGVGRWKLVEIMLVEKTRRDLDTPRRTLGSWSVN